MAIIIPKGQVYPLNPPQNPLPLDSKFLQINSHNFLLNTTFKTGLKSPANSLLYYKLNADFSPQSTKGIEVCDVEHLRCFKKIRTPLGEGVLMADHGVDEHPFPGSKPKLLIEKDGQLINMSDKIEAPDSYYFDATPIRIDDQNYDEIILNVYPSAKNRPTFLKFKDGVYTGFPELLPSEWVTSQFGFMTSLDVSGIVNPGTHLLLGLNDSADPNLDRNRILSYKNKKWTFNQNIHLPAIQKKMGWGTVYSATGKVTSKQKGTHLVMLNHNKGFSDAVAQILYYDENYKMTEEKIAENCPYLEGYPFYFHKVLFFDVDNDGEKELLITLREVRNWNYEKQGCDLLVFKRTSDGVWNYQKLFFENETHDGRIENIDSISDTLLIKYFSPNYRVITF